MRPKSDPLTLGWNIRSHDLANRVEDHFELTVIPFFEIPKFSSQFFLREKKLP